MDGFEGGEGWFIKFVDERSGGLIDGVGLEMHMGTRGRLEYLPYGGIGWEVKLTGVVLIVMDVFFYLAVFGPPFGCIHRISGLGTLCFWFWFLAFCYDAFSFLSPLHSALVLGSRNGLI